MEEKKRRLVVAEEKTEEDRQSRCAGREKKIEYKIVDC